MRPQDAEITTTQGHPVVKNSKGWIMSGGILLRSIRLAALVVVEIWAATGCLCAMADDAVDAFPPELVKFDPIKANPVFQGRGEGNWDEHIRERGWILRDGDKWQMWYTGFEGGGGDNGPHLKLGYATSSDGLQWRRYPGNPVYDESWVEDMMVVKRLDTYYMFAEGQHDIAQLLTSTDGIHWTLVGPLDIRLTNGQPISAGPRGTPTAYYENDRWYLFYERRDLGIWLATSKDTKVWTNVDDEPVIKLGPNEYDSRQIALNQIVKYKGRYYAYYHGSGNEQPRLWSTNVAVSNDLVHWVKYRDNPLLPIEDNKSSGILVDDGKQFRLYTMHDKVEVHFPIGAEQTAQVNIQQWEKGLPSDPNFFSDRRLASGSQECRAVSPGRHQSLRWLVEGADRRTTARAQVGRHAGDLCAEPGRSQFRERRRDRGLDAWRRARQCSTSPRRQRLRPADFARRDRRRLPAHPAARFVAPGAVEPRARSRFRPVHRTRRASQSSRRLPGIHPGLRHCFVRHLSRRA